MNSGNTGDEPTLRQRFLEAVCTEQLGTQREHGVTVTLKEFKAFFPGINRNYLSSFLASATLESGRSQMTYSKYLMRSSRGVYLVHPDVFEP